VEVVVIANDVQGAEVAKPWVEVAGGTYRSLLDQHNTIGKAYGLKFVPVGILLDEEGRLVRGVGSVNIDQDEFREELSGWVETGVIPKAWIDADNGAEIGEMSGSEKEADARFQLAIVLLEQDKRDDAIKELKRAFRLDPKNWLIRKQLWAVEHPEVFYDGNVDYTWQKEQMAREDAAIASDP
jgi:tetratricopeptide (TPR) repeat protein